MDVEQILKSREAWYLWVIEYGITHSVMRIALHQGDYPQHHELVCGDARTFHGALQGGPYRLRLEMAQTDRSIRLYDEEGRLELRCGSIILGTSRI
jgi:hypothetical protein